VADSKGSSAEDVGAGFVEAGVLGDGDGAGANGLESADVAGSRGAARFVRAGAGLAGAGCGDGVTRVLAASLAKGPGVAGGVEMAGLDAGAFSAAGAGVGAFAGAGTIRSGGFVAGTAVG
jgi:hypothetical protein